MRADKMVLQVEMPAAKPDNLSWIPWSLMVERENRLLQAVLCPLHGPMARMPPQNTKINSKCLKKVYEF